MNTHLLNRAIGTSPPTTLRTSQYSRLIHALQPAHAHFNGQHVWVDGARNDDDENKDQQKLEVAHSGGTNSIAIDKFEGRYLLSGGADATISIWDVETTYEAPDSTKTEHRPLGSIPKSDEAHQYGITHVSFYPFDSLAFLTTSYDHTLKIWSSETLQPSASFNLDAVVYSHALSSIASHLLVACAVQHPTVRLVDLKSGASTHSLPGHHGAVLSVSWSPVDEHILCSAGTDGTVRFWDVRRSASSLGVLDLEDSIGIPGYDGLGSGARGRQKGRAHDGVANGVVWTEDGQHVVTTGHDEKVRIWDVRRGANTLASFGPVIKNSHLSTLLPLVAPMNITDSGHNVLFFPSEKEILMYELFEGRLLKRLKTPASSWSSESSASAHNRKLKSRTTALAWRAHNVDLYSAHGDGTIRAWKPRTTEDASFEEEENEIAREREEERRAKRKVLEDVYENLTKRRAIG